MAEDTDLFLFGDDLDAVLEALEANDIIDESFNEAITEVLEDDVLCTLCSKKCKSLRGLKRHMTCKHKDDLEDKGEPTEEDECNLTADLLSNMVGEVKQRIVNNKVFSNTMREELSSYSFTNLPEESPEFTELRKIFKQLIKKNNHEQFYTKFYSTVPLNSTKYFTGLSRNSATLLSTKLADCMVAYSKNKTVMAVRNFKYELSEREVAGLQYVGGYVLHKLHNKHSNIVIACKQFLLLLPKQIHEWCNFMLCFAHNTDEVIT